jgi:hypothetical protein
MRYDTARWIIPLMFEVIKGRDIANMVSEEDFV